MVFPGHPETQELAGLAGGFRKSRGKKTERHLKPPEKECVAGHFLRS